MWFFPLQIILHEDASTAFLTLLSIEYFESRVYTMNKMYTYKYSLSFEFVFLQIANYSRNIGRLFFKHVISFQKASSLYD